ncbi:YbaK/EbsC family protein [Desulfovibrio sp. OttesenSCG-928-C06]|nr:YbaK/EbsC family protein [Desulfovibrio sp. OttesenSCG-928-C06]
MSVEDVRRYLDNWGRGADVREFPVSTATVDLAAAAVGVEGARIAKTLTFKAPAPENEELAEGAFPAIVLVAAGDARIDGAKFKQAFGVKSKMLSPEEALAATGHAVGGVCPFAIENPMARIYLDESLRRFETVFPACGSSSSCIEMTCDELFVTSRAIGWVDACKGWQEE